MLTFWGNFDDTSGFGSPGFLVFIDGSIFTDRTVNCMFFRFGPKFASWHFLNHFFSRLASPSDLPLGLPAIGLRLQGFSLTLYFANSLSFSASLSDSSSTSDCLLSYSSSVNSHVLKLMDPLPEFSSSSATFKKLNLRAKILRTLQSRGCQSYAALTFSSPAWQASELKRF